MVLRQKGGFGFYTAALFRRKSTDLRLGTLSLAIVSSPLMRLEQLIPAAPLAQWFSAGASASRGHLTMSGVIFGCCSWGGGTAAGI